MRTLTAGQAGAEAGAATALLVFLHGYGADGSDLLGLADPIAAHLPGWAFAAPDAPEPCHGNPYGRQWFPIPWLDGSPEAAAEAGLDRAAEDLNAWLDDALSRYGLAPARLALFGFSQGAMMAMHVALRRAEPVGAVIACSGRLLRPAALVTDIRARPPVLLMHGDQDPVVPFADMARAGQALQEAEVPAFGYVMEGTAHGIAPDGLGAAVGFLAKEMPG
jgi:phospholipase/carboxylesterase